jgi:hypothetical protein
MKSNGRTTRWCDPTPYNPENNSGTVVVDTDADPRKLVFRPRPGGLETPTSAAAPCRGEIPAAVLM